METPKLSEVVTAVLVGGAHDGLEITYRGEGGVRMHFAPEVDAGDDRTDYLFVGVADGRAIYSCLPGAA